MAPDSGPPALDGRPGQVQGLLSRYEEIARESRAMLEAAGRGDWERVEQIEARCRELIEGLKRAATGSPLTQAEQRHRIALLRAILEDDAQIRERAEPWLRELEELLRTRSEPEPLA